MDTRFWGPSGWRLLHLISFTYEPKQKESVKELFETLRFGLPCKYCRASFTDYLAEEPIEPALQSRTSFTKWLYKIHNKVNAKLRSQNLLHESDPSFSSVKKVYEERVQQGCMRTEFEGWDFLFSIVENHPFSQSSKGSTPMPDMPPGMETSKDPVERNRWNILEPAERMPYYIRFWKSLEGSLPFEEWREGWKNCSPRVDRLTQKKELWRIRCCLEKKLDLVNREKFESVCRRLNEHKSGCNKVRRGKTCRRMTKKRVTRKKK